MLTWSIWTSCPKPTPTSFSRARLTRPISPYLNKCDMQSNNCAMLVYVLGDSDFKYTMSPATFILAIFKDGGLQYKCHHISKTTSPREIMLMLLDTVMDSDISRGIYDRQQHKFAPVLKMASVKAYYYVSYEIHCRSFFHRILRDSYCRRV